MDDAGLLPKVAKLHKLRPKRVRNQIPNRSLHWALVTLGWKAEDTPVQKELIVHTN
jgi:hypothetical protein